MAHPQKDGLGLYSTFGAHRDTPVIFCHTDSNPGTLYHNTLQKASVLKKIIERFSAAKSFLFYLSVNYNIFRSISFLPPTHTPEQSAQLFHRQNAQRKQRRQAELARRQRHGAKDTAAQINEGDLIDQHSRHDRKKSTVLSQPRQRAQAIGSGVEAVKDRRKNKQRKKGGQMAQIRNRLQMVGCFKNNTQSPTV